jgi:hypothetical protein
MEDRKNSIKDKIAMFNQISSKNENNSNKPSINYIIGSNIIEKKFPQLKNVKIEVKKDINIKKEEKKRN